MASKQATNSTYEQQQRKKNKNKATIAKARALHLFSVVFFFVVVVDNVNLPFSLFSSVQAYIRSPNSGFLKAKQIQENISHSLRFSYTIESKTARVRFKVRRSFNVKFK